MYHPLWRPRLHQALACTAIWLTAAMAAAQPDTKPGRDALYQSDVQACKSGRSGQDTDTCLTEARRARDARKKGALDTQAANVQANARARCAVFTGDARDACHARIDGRGSVSGSVSGGGILRQIETDVPAGAVAQPAVATPVIPKAAVSTRP